MPRDLKLPWTLVCPLYRYVAPSKLIDWSVTAGEEVVLLVLPGKHDYRDPSGQFPKTRADRPNTYRVIRVLGDRVERLTLAPTRENYYNIRSLGNGNLLLMAAGHRQRSVKNAVVYGPDGRPRRRFEVGHAVHFVSAFEGGPVWFSHFDEGYMTDSPLGRHGLISMSERGDLLFGYNNLETRRPTILDCYAMNCPGPDEAWAYLYPNFPIVRIVNGALAAQWPPVPVRGARGMAVHDRRVLLLGSYDERDRLALIDLDRRVVRRVRSRSRCGAVMDAQGCGPVLYARTSKGLCKLDMRGLPARRPTPAPARTPARSSRRQSPRPARR